MHVYTSAWNSERNRRPRTRGRLHLLAMAQPPLLQPRRLPTFLCGYGCTAFSVVPPAGGRCFGRNLQIAAPDPDPLPPANQVGYRVGNTQRESVTTEAKGEENRKRTDINKPTVHPGPRSESAPPSPGRSRSKSKVRSPTTPGSSSGGNRPTPGVDRRHPAEAPQASNARRSR